MIHFMYNVNTNTEVNCCMLPIKQLATSPCMYADRPERTVNLTVPSVNQTYAGQFKGPFYSVAINETCIQRTNVDDSSLTVDLRSFDLDDCLLHGLFIFKHVRHTHFLSVHVNVLCILFLVCDPQPPELVLTLRNGTN